MSSSSGAQFFAADKPSLLNRFKEIKKSFFEGEFDPNDTNIVERGLLHPDSEIAQAAMNAFSRDPYTQRYEKAIQSIFNNRYSDPERCIALINAMEGYGKIDFLESDFSQLIKAASPEIRVCVANAVLRYGYEYQHLEQPVWDNFVLCALKSNDPNLQKCGFQALAFMKKKHKFTRFINHAITNFNDPDIAQNACRATRGGMAKDFAPSLDKAVQQVGNCELSYEALCALGNFLDNPSCCTDASPRPDEILVHALSHPDDVVVLHACNVIEREFDKTPYAQALVDNVLNPRSSVPRKMSAFVGMCNADDPYPFQFALLAGLHNQNEWVQSSALRMMETQYGSAFLGFCQDIIRTALRSPFPEIASRALSLAEGIMDESSIFILYPDIAILENHASQPVSELARKIVLRAKGLGESRVPTNPLASLNNAQHSRNVRLVFGIKENGINPQCDTAADGARKLVERFSRLSKASPPSDSCTVQASVFFDPHQHLFPGEQIAVRVPSVMFDKICQNEARGIAEEYTLTRLLGEFSFSLVS